MMTPEAYLDALLSLPGMYAPRVSPDGQWVAWVWFRAGPAADVYAARTDGSADPVRLTDSLDNTLLVAWTPDSTAVLVVQDKDGNERAQVFRIRLDQPLVMQPLTEADPPYFLRGGQLHPNGRWLVYGANFDVATGQEIEPTWIYRHDLTTGDRLPLAKPEQAAYLTPELNTTGTHILYERQDLHPGGLQVWLVDIEGNSDREILNFGADVKTYATWLPDGERVLFMTELPTHRKVGLWHLATGDIRWLLDDPTRNIENVTAPERTGYIVVNEVRAARLHSYLLDPETGQELHLPTIPGNLELLAPLPQDARPDSSVEGELWAGRYYSATHPADVVRFNIRDVQPDQFVSLTQVMDRTSLTPVDLTPAEDFRWQSVDKLEIQGWLYRTRGTPLGTIVYVHGGPTAHSQDAINVQIQFFVRSGFNVLDPNYRGSTGFGMTFREAIKEDGWGGREQDDIRTGIEALIAAGVAEPGKVGMTGTSYGGYSSWCAITRFPPELLAASAPVCGMTDLVVDYETTRPDLRPYSAEMLGGTPTQVPEKYHARSPIHFVGDIHGQLLIVQGMQDPNVTPENVRAVTGVLQTAGIEYGLLAFDDEGHGISKPKNQKTLYLRLRDFFAGMSGGTASPAQG